MVTKKRLAVVSVLAVLALGGAMGFKRYRGAKDKAEAPANLAAVSRGDIEVHFTDAGEFWPKRGIDIASKVSGRVLELAVAEGSRVKKGDRLVVIQPGRSETEQYVPTPILAPLDGVVMRYQKQGYQQDEAKIVKLGDFVTGLIESNEPTYLMTVADLSQLVVKMKISEMDILKLKEGMAVTVTVDAMPGSSFPAKVSLVSPQAEKDNNNLKNFKVEVLLLKSDPRLKPGMTARVDGLLDSRKKVLTMPLSAVFEEGGKEVAYQSEPKAKPKKIVLKLGLRNETDVEVMDGLKEGQQVFTEKPEEKKS